MKSLIIAGFTALSLSTRAGASPQSEHSLMIDPCSFAKSVDGSATSGQCAKEPVDARGPQGRGRVMPVGEEKRPDRGMRDQRSIDSLNGNPSDAQGPDRTNGLGRNIVSFFEIALPIPLVLFGGALTAPGWVPLSLLGAAGVVTVDGLAHAFTGKGLVERLF